MAAEDVGNSRAARERRQRRVREHPLQSGAVGDAGVPQEILQHPGVLDVGVREQRLELDRVGDLDATSRLGELEQLLDASDRLDHLEQLRDPTGRLRQRHELRDAARGLGQLEQHAEMVNVTS